MDLNYEILKHFFKKGVIKEEEFTAYLNEAKETEYSI